MIGNRQSDQVGLNGVTVLGNGNYVVASSRWDRGPITDAGAVTFGSGITGISGLVSTVNSLIGSDLNDLVGSAGVIALTNSNYVVLSPNWDGASQNVGAVTFGSGTSGMIGEVSITNSLVGNLNGDQVGLGATALNNGNYVVRSPNWDQASIANVGAATFGSGTVGISGAVSASNSLVGSTAEDQVGLEVSALANSNYVVCSPDWDNGANFNAGAATFGSGSVGISGAVSVSNSLVGGSDGDSVGSPCVTALSNGNYVVASPNWDVGIRSNVGAATFGSGTTGVSGVVSAANSLVGNRMGDSVGRPGVFALSNGDYVVASALWDTAGTFDVGAVTLGSGTSGTVGVVSAANSLIGDSPGDRVGVDGVSALSNGNFVVASSLWDNGSKTDAGAATFVLASGGTSGVVSAVNSLVGNTANDQVSSHGVTALSNGNYVVATPRWNDGATVARGAATFGSGTSGISGIVSTANSLVGNSSNDFVAIAGLTALSNGNYVVNSASWNNGGTADAGAMTLGLANGSVVGAISNTHSVLGAVASQGTSHVFAYDSLRNQLAVG